MEHTEMTATSTPTSASRFFTLASADGRTPMPLNVVGEETLVKVSAADSED
jgi:hypothetical protein